MSQKDPAQVSIGIPIILILSSVLILTFTALAFIIIKPLRKDLKETQENNFGQITRTLAALADVEFRGNEEIVSSLARTAETMLTATYDMTEGREIARAASFGETVTILKGSHPSFLTSFLLDDQGRVLFSSSDNLIGKDLSDREYFKAIINDGKDSYTTGKALTSASTGLKTIVHAAGVKENGQTRFILGTSYDLEAFGASYFSADENREEGELFLFDSEGVFLIQPDEERDYTSASELSPLFEEVIREKQKSWHGSLNYGGIPRRGNLFRIDGTGWYVGMTQKNSVADRSIYHIRRIFIISNVVVILLIIAVISLYIRFNLVHKVRSLENLITLASNGQLTERGYIRGRDEIAGMTRHINGHLDSLSRFFISLAENLGDLEDVGSDLAANMEETAASLVQIKNNVESTLSHIDRQENTVNSTAAAVEETNRNIQSLERNIIKQNSHIDLSSSAVEEMAAQAGSVDHSAGKAGDLMGELTNSTREGRMKIDRVTELVEAVSAKSHELENANALISGIAARTNLLAMNAAIEAAHAGNAGRGFAVVADEIRKLAEQAAEQSGQVKKTIGDINGQIEEAVRGSADSDRSFEEIRGKIAGMTHIIEEIRATTREQAASGAEVLASLNSLKESGEEVKDGSREMREGNRLILQAVDDLMEICSSVTMAMREISGGMQEINRAAETITSLSHRNRKNIREVREQASIYKVS